ncbi:MAG: beta galactosidase jelly roll domain-containing protein [Marinilabiliaceae bacterium]|nr:beta galactosidase jelly roll domain-containing protein [Marinilabiliaceae bacterium]
MKILKYTLFFSFLLSINQNLISQLITNVYARQTFSLNGKWNYIIDPYETGYYDYRYQPHDSRKNPWDGFFLDKKQTDKTQLVEYSFDQSPTLMVPGDWNSQDDKLLYYEGTIWYRKKFDYKKTDSNNRVFVYFGAANYETDVYLNGKKLGKHIGGFTPFSYEITNLLKENENSIVVKVDNKRKREGVPTLNTDWWNYGGITRDVMIVELPKTFVSDYTIQLPKGSTKSIRCKVKLSDPVANKKITVTIPELKINANLSTDNNGEASVILPVKKISLWSPENPKLYNVNISDGTETISDEIGFRTIETKGHDILLNGKSIFLRGICIHEENAMRGGRAYSEEDAAMLLNWVKELNCNYVRLAHYPHNEHMLKLADKLGILVWEENPVYWTILWDNEETFNNAKQQLTDVIERDKNRASVIIWSMANETPVSEPRNMFLGNLAKHARSLDDTRLISAALEVHGEKNNVFSVEDPFSDYVDIINFNQYIGWYNGLPEKCDKVTWKINYNKPVMISEFGGGALQGMHGDNLTRWSEEYQSDLYDRTLKMLDKIPQFRGVSPWILCDFRSPRRVLPVIQDGWNRKGVIGENGTKKKAFFTLKNFYTKKKESFK